MHRNTKEIEANAKQSFIKWANFWSFIPSLGLSFVWKIEEIMLYEKEILLFYFMPLCQIFHYDQYLGEAV